MTKQRILRIPPGHPVTNDPRIDKVEEDPNLDEPVVVTEEVPTGEDDIVDRRRISGDSRKIFADERRALKAARTAGDVQAEVDALEKMVDDLCNIVIGKSLDELELEYPAEDDGTA